MVGVRWKGHRTLRAPKRPPRCHLSGRNRQKYGLISAMCQPLFLYSVSPPVPPQNKPTTVSKGIFYLVVAPSVILNRINLFPGLIFSRREGTTFQLNTDHMIWEFLISNRITNLDRGFLRNVSHKEIHGNIFTIHIFIHHLVNKRVHVVGVDVWVVLKSNNLKFTRV